jgi:hypothetical protein
MNEKPMIPITCKGQKYLPIDKLNSFQGNLKVLPPDQEDQLRSVILKYGFSFPVFIWGQSIIDGHQRLSVLKSLLAEGYQIKGGIPVVEIEAKDEQEAAEKVLLIESHYGRVTNDGLLEFITDFNIDMALLKDDLNLPDIDMDHFFTDFMEEDILPESSETAQPDQALSDTVTIRIMCGRDIWASDGQAVLKDIEKCVAPYDDQFTIQLTE